MEKEMYLSLYDFLNKPAGGQLGKEVYKSAKLKKIKTKTRDISNPKYNGKIMLYPKTFLVEYFNTNF